MNDQKPPPSFRGVYARALAARRKVLLAAGPPLRWDAPALSPEERIVAIVDDLIHRSLHAAWSGYAGTISIESMYGRDPEITAQSL